MFTPPMIEVQEGSLAGVFSPAPFRCQFLTVLIGQCGNDNSSICIVSDLGIQGLCWRCILRYKCHSTLRQVGLFSCRRDIACPKFFLNVAFSSTLMKKLKFHIFTGWTSFWSSTLPWGKSLVSVVPLKLQCG